MTINFAIVGCGGMGMRHAYGYTEILKIFGKQGVPGAEPIKLAAVCDLHTGPANSVADMVQQETGFRPRVYVDFETMLSEVSDLDAIDIVTDTPWHHKFSIAALESGRHAMTEKPMGLTLKACRQMRDASEKNGKILSVAENYRRDPLNRLTLELINSGAIGNPYFAVDIGMGSAGGAVMHSTVWRAKKNLAGGMVMDAGVHNADMLLYLMGPADTVFAETATYETQRELRDMSSVAHNLADMYRHRVESGGKTGDIIEQDAVDTVFSLIKFKSGAIGQLCLTDVSHGETIGQSSIHGSNGTLLRTSSRSGKPPIIRRPNGEEIVGNDLLSLVPDWRLDEVTATLWDSDRLGSYDLDWRDIDKKIVAIEYADLARAISSNSSPEVGPLEGMAALALSYGVMESGLSRQPVSLSDVIDGTVSQFQNEIDETAGI